MGLDVTHDCWHGAYSAFHRWRCMLAKVAGMPPLNMMEGFLRFDHPGLGTGFKKMISDLVGRYGDVGPQNFDEAWDQYLPGFPIQWEALRPDVLHVLLNHSDCDGSIEHKDCAPLADRLEELIPLLPQGSAGGHVRNWRKKTQAFVDGLRAAHEAGEDVEFH